MESDNRSYNLQIEPWKRKTCLAPGLSPRMKANEGNMFTKVECTPIPLLLRKSGLGIEVIYSISQQTFTKLYC